MYPYVSYQYIFLLQSPTEDYYSHMPSSPSLDLLDKASISLTHSPSQLDNSNWIEESLEIGLPSFRPTYMFLVRVLLEVIHEAIMIRLEQLENPIVAPSFLSIRQVRGVFVCRFSRWETEGHMLYDIYIILLRSRYTHFLSGKL